MVFSAVFVANLYNGLNTSAWTGWVFFAINIGTLLIWVYTVSLVFNINHWISNDTFVRPSTMP